MPSGYTARGSGLALHSHSGSSARFSISLSEPSQFCALVGFRAYLTPVPVEACSLSHALLHSAAHGRELEATAGALPVLPRFIPTCF